MSEHKTDIQRSHLTQQYREIRAATERICHPLATDDYQIQSITETSPPKWHLAHVSWFFETFVLPEFDPGFAVHHPAFAYLFNSYYETVGNMQPRPQRGLLSRPTVKEIYAYRQAVDEQMLTLINSISNKRWMEFATRVTLGLHHEQQHQELLLMDIKHNLFMNPLLPAYRTDLVPASNKASQPFNWLEFEGGISPVGHNDIGFAFDNESPRHDQLLQPHKLADRLVSNAEYLAFIEDNGYQRSELWLADGWYHIRKHGWQAPLYWRQHDDKSWWHFSLAGLQPLPDHAPVCHLSFYEADAFARWQGKRLPSEAELETRLNNVPVEGNFVDSDLLSPASGSGQWYGDVWEWTSTPYAPFPGFKPLSGSMGEYNGKFMCNQMTLKGGSCVTQANHIRASYRNFFYPYDRWAFSGLRLAENL